MSAAELSHGWCFGFNHFSAERYPVEAREIERMYRVVRTLRRAYETECAQVGQPRSFGQFVLWHLGPLRLRGLLKRDEDRGPSSFVLHVGSLADAIDREVRRVALDLARLDSLDGIPASPRAA